MSETKTYTVEGMTCEHCRASVTEEVGEVAGVESVDVDLASGRLDVRGADFAEAELEDAVEEAGYTLAGSR